MADAYVSTYEGYLSAWSAIDDNKRLRLLTDSLSSRVVFKNSTQTRTGIPDVAKHLEQFQQTTPGGSFRILSMLGWGENALVSWQLVNADGTDGFKGYDTIAFGEDGRIGAIVMFVDVEPQRFT